MKYLKTVSIILATAFAASVIVWLAYENLSPSGVYKVVWKPNVSSAKIGPLVPESRISGVETASDETPYRTIMSEPVNFDVKVPRSFDTVEVGVKYNGNAKIFEIGGLASRQTWTNIMQPAENTIIDNLKWTRVAANGLTLYERKPDFATIEDFVSKMPRIGVATYRAYGYPETKPPKYYPSGKVEDYKVAFRGATTIKVYLENEKLNFLFKMQDLNRSVGTDVFTAVATLNGTELARGVLNDDGNASSDGKLSAINDLRLYTDKLYTGVVTINLPAPDDIVFRETITPQTKFVFINHLYLADNVGYSAEPAAASLVSNGKKISATTSHATSFQTIKIGASSLAINDMNTPFVAYTGTGVGGTMPIISPAGDLRLETAGLFAFTADNFWQPAPPELTAESDVDKDGINYILTSYVPPLHNGIWRTALASFDFNRLAPAADRSVNFILSLPGKTAADDFNVAEIDVIFRRPSMKWNDILVVWNKIVKTISAKL
jgi:hypothetical protein